MTPATAWQPSFGAWPENGGIRFRVWAPRAGRVAVALEGKRPGTVELERGPDGSFAGWTDAARPGDLYRYTVDDTLFPDPASRWQPDGAHGASQVIDPSGFAWSDQEWTGLDMADLVLYELHVGTFTPEGTFRSAMERLPSLAELGVTAVELMPVAEFAGRRNWGYDGAALFAPSRAYGHPDDLRQFVDRAHALSLAVHLDVVYNHLGPDGAYLAAVSPEVFSERHRSPWGAGINLDGPGSELVRAFFIENALHWVHEYHIDGLRLDATHALVDESPRHFLAELASRVHASPAARRRRVLVIAEDSRNLAIMVERPERGGWGLDGVWADDMHHQIRRHVAGDREGYYEDFTGSIDDLAETIRGGWFFRGQDAPHFGGLRGTDPSGIPPSRFVVCVQNHDQVGNRAIGERLHHQIDPAAWRAASALLLAVPETPLLFMGQEWAASTPFLFFTDHHPELGRLVTEGRRGEFRHFSSFSDPAARARIPDPQAFPTFEASRLRWSERDEAPHAAVLALYRALLALRRGEPAVRRAERFAVESLDEGTLCVERHASGAPSILAVVRLSGRGRVALDAGGAAWETVLSTEDARYAPDGRPPRVEVANGEVAVDFPGPGAVFLREIR